MKLLVNLAIGAASLAVVIWFLSTVVGLLMVTA